MKHPWDRSLGLWYLAEHHPDHPAVLSSPSGGPVTTSELAARAHRVVHALRARGVGHGDVIGMALPNDVDIVVWQLAATEAGWRYVTLSTRSTAAEVTEIAAHSEMKALVVHASFAEGAGAATGVPIRVSAGGHIEGFTPQDELVRDQPGTAPPDRTAGAALVSTSGTTGKPKGIWRDLPGVAPEVMADGMKTFAHAFRFKPLGGAHLVSAGMFHGGCQAFYLAALHVGQPLVIMGSFDAEETLRLIQEHRVTIVDRIRDMIIAGGVNVYPAEAEAVLTVHPAVLDCAVIGVPDPEWGEQVRVIVQPAPGHESSDELAAELIAYCRERLTSHKCPRAVEFRDELPRTDTGKLYKRLLRDEFREREAAARGAGTGSRSA